MVEENDVQKLKQSWIGQVEINGKHIRLFKRYFRKKYHHIQH
jgi:hypothetical protein